jgi:hypothetical protein
MKITNLLLAAAVAISGLSAATAANAAIAINISQVGTSVVASGGGNFNTSNLVAMQNGGFSVGLNAGFGIVRFGQGAGGNSFQSFAISGPAAFGPGNGNYNYATGVGDIFGIFGLGNSTVLLPTNYVSGTALAGTITFANSTLSSLGLTTGTYRFSNANDTVTINITNVAAVPEPATWGLMVLGFGMIGAAARSRKVKTTVAYA